MRRFAVTVFFLGAALAAAAPMPACQLPQGDSDAGADAAADGIAVSPDPIGADCTAVAPATTLCAAISLCPNFLLDATLFPHCGFRMHGAVLDLECWCDGNLCPIGVPATCDQIPGLLDGQTEDTVCVQVNEGRCTNLAGSSSSSGAGSGSSCDKDCQAACGGVPSCVQQCGC
jgi:hypothetical protein